MYISRVEIDRYNRRKVRDLTHVGAYHAWVEESFPSELEQSIRTRKLWRIDRIQGKDYLIIVSKEKPNFQKLEKYGVVGSSQTKDYQHFLNNIKTGCRMNFRVVLNPVISNGFSLVGESFSIVERGYEVFQKPEKPIRLSKVVYEGTLTVSDDTLFKKMLTEGVGKKKAYGFGLMTVVPLEE